jgi:BASS family bile acid:Na+ symporter
MAISSETSSKAKALALLLTSTLPSATNAFGINNYLVNLPVNDIRKVSDSVSIFSLALAPANLTDATDTSERIRVNGATIPLTKVYSFPPSGNGAFVPKSNGLSEESAATPPPPPPAANGAVNGDHNPAFTFPFNSNGASVEDTSTPPPVTVNDVPPPPPPPQPTTANSAAVGNSYLDNLKPSTGEEEKAASEATPTLGLNYLESMTGTPADSNIIGHKSPKGYLENLTESLEMEGLSNGQRANATNSTDLLSSLSAARQEIAYTHSSRQQSYLENLTSPIINEQNASDLSGISDVPSISAMDDEPPAVSDEMIQISQDTKSNNVLSTLTSGFPLFVLSAAAIGLKRPSALMWVNKGQLIPIMLAFVMMSTGTTLQTKDFTSIISSKNNNEDGDSTTLKAISAGTLSQYLIVPLAAYFIANAALLPAFPSAFLGLVLVGCSPGGAVSSLVSLVARGDVALSVILTSISAILTPVLVKTVGGSSGISISSLVLGKATLKAVLLPIAAGMFIRDKAPQLANKIGKLAPFLSMVLVSLLCGGVVAQNAVASLAGGLTKGAVTKIIMAVFSLHTIGFLSGYLTSKKVFGLSEKASRTISIETGMQNSALALVMARSIFANMSGVSSSMLALACLPGAISATVHSCLGSALAVYWRNKGGDDGAESSVVEE